MITPFCCLCGDLTPLEEHHVIPRVHGGTDESNNIISICSPCHARIHEAGVRRGNMRALAAEGIKRAKAAGVYKGKAPVIRDNATPRVLELREQGVSHRDIADTCGIGVATVYRICKSAALPKRVRPTPEPKKTPVAPEPQLTRGPDLKWGQIKSSPCSTKKYGWLAAK